ncbi:MAG: hypothetical protein EPN75_13385 [Beijerinckiaceae bacterium]|nr:MAG: hypothetical protein EPN75_13385 [Beijerinckiaceae bacterium]
MIDLSRVEIVSNKNAESPALSISIAEDPASWLPILRGFERSCGERQKHGFESGRPGARSVLARGHPDVPVDEPFATFTEWDSDADRKAYANL